MMYTEKRGAYLQNMSMLFALPAFLSFSIDIAEFRRVWEVHVSKNDKPPLTQANLLQARVYVWK